MRRRGNRSKLMGVLWRGLAGDRLAEVAARQLRAGRVRDRALSLDRLQAKVFSGERGPPAETALMAERLQSRSRPELRRG